MRFHANVIELSTDVDINALDFAILVLHTLLLVGEWFYDELSFDILLLFYKNRGFYNFPLKLSVSLFIWLRSLLH